MDWQTEPQPTPAQYQAIPADAGSDDVAEVVLEAVRHLDDLLCLKRFTSLVRLQAVQERAARHYQDAWCAEERALRDVLRHAVTAVAEVLPTQAAATLRALAEGHTAAEVAREFGVQPAALRKRVTPQIEEALASYLEHLEAQRSVRSRGASH